MALLTSLKCESRVAAAHLAAMHRLSSAQTGSSGVLGHVYQMDKGKSREIGVRTNGHDGQSGMLNQGPPGRLNAGSLDSAASSDATGLGVSGEARRNSM